MPKKTIVVSQPKSKPPRAPVKYEPPKLTRFEKLERLIVAGE
jgi:hypothetical protein